MASIALRRQPRRQGGGLGHALDVERRVERLGRAGHHVGRAAVADQEQLGAATGGRGSEGWGTAVGEVHRRGRYSVDRRCGSDGWRSSRPLLALAGCSSSGSSSSWTALPADALGPGLVRLVHAAGDGQQLLGVGSVTADGDRVPGVWRTTDGTTWQHLDAVPEEHHRRAQRADRGGRGADGAAAAVGQTTGGTHGNPRVGTWSLDGTTLTEHPGAGRALRRAPAGVGQRDRRRAGGLRRGGHPHRPQRAHRRGGVDVARRSRRVHHPRRRPRPRERPG